MIHENDILIKKIYLQEKYKRGVKISYNIFTRKIYFEFIKLLRSIDFDTVIRQDTIQIL